MAINAGGVGELTPNKSLQLTFETLSFKEHNKQARRGRITCL